MNKDKMIGPKCHTGPGGRDCVCCNEAPGRGRKRDRRIAKRRERQAWKKNLSNM